MNFFLLVRYPDDFDTKSSKKNKTYSSKTYETQTKLENIPEKSLSVHRGNGFLHNQMFRILQFVLLFHYRSRIEKNPSFQSHIRFLILDNDSIFNRVVQDSIVSLGISPIRTSLKSPWQNAFAERFIGSIRRILINHVIIFGEHHARSLIRNFVHFYNNFRPHQSLSGQSPLGRAVSNRASPNSHLRSHSVLNGLSHFYDWEEDAA